MEVGILSACLSVDFVFPGMTDMVYLITWQAAWGSNECDCVVINYICHINLCLDYTAPSTIIANPGKDAHKSPLNKAFPGGRPLVDSKIRFLSPSTFLLGLASPAALFISHPEPGPDTREVF
ncbi:hypothetical protein AMECASPLE_018887 [Ameca splendens]|uniref:Uncharacterized protein n=1 Tax=Ameca splendens TaxID=208324 RepID=A0ABV0YDW9_9TELE